MDRIAHGWINRRGVRLSAEECRVLAVLFEIAGAWAHGDELDVIFMEDDE